MTDSMIKRVVAEAWLHLETRYAENRSGKDPAYADRNTQTIEGRVDMAALVRAVLIAMREPTEAMIDDRVARAAAFAGDLDDVWLSMIEVALAEDPR